MHSHEVDAHFNSYMYAHSPKGMLHFGLFASLYNLVSVFAPKTTQCLRQTCFLQTLLYFLAFYLKFSFHFLFEMTQKSCENEFEKHNNRRITAEAYVR